VAESKPERQLDLHKRYNITSANLTVLLEQEFDYVVLAVKPQDSQAIAMQVNTGWTDNLIISVMAGIPTSQLQAWFGSDRIVRTMPNTPARLGLGMTVWTATPGVSELEKKFIQQLLQQLGKELYVHNDNWIDKATAVSGSGPAYLFLFAEQFMAAAQELGFSAEQAQQLVSQTVLGAATLLQTAPPAQLRAQVTSKGGTTAAALNTVMNSDVANIWEQAVQAAYKRAQELSATTS
jgi:pyrroline-5-carboxylate reductase